MTDAHSLSFLVFSDDSTVREDVMLGVGSRLTPAGTPITWTEAATAEGVRLACKDREAQGLPPFDLFVFDSETKKLGGMGLAHEFFTDSEQRPPVVLLTARPQDSWLASWARVQAVVSRPLTTTALRDAVAQAYQARPGSVVAAG